MKIELPKEHHKLEVPSNPITKGEIDRLKGDVDEVFRKHKAALKLE